MKERWQRVAALAIGATVLAGGVIGASAQEDGGGNGAGPASIADSAKDRFLEVFGFEESESASPGVIDDGEELLPQAGITLDEAIAAAQGAASGPLGEIDLEHYRGVLVFNVDIGDQDVKIDAATGDLLGLAED